MSQQYGYHLLDVFTDHVFGGNQLAVFTEAAAMPPALMPRIARELNLSETVFVLPPTDPTADRRLRIFTPGAELPFAGHPTIGTACLLDELGMVPARRGADRLVFQQAAGTVDVRLLRGAPGRPVFAQLSAPERPQTRPAPVPPDVIAELLGLGVADLVTETGRDAAAASCGVPFLFVSLRSRRAVAAVRLNAVTWERHVAATWAPHVYVYAFDPERAGSDIRARMFAPAMGIAEDPATGGAACALAGLLAERDGREGTLRWRIEQGFEMGRPSILDSEATVAGGVVREARVGGTAVRVGTGTLQLA